MIKVWGRLTSGNVQKVMWAIGELGLPHERVDLAGPFGGNREPAYLAKNPNGLVPTIEDGGLTMFESNAIVRYLARAYGAGTLEPSDPLTYGRANQWMDWATTTVTPPHVQVFGNLFFKTAAERDVDAIEKGRAAFTAAMTIFDAHLQQSAFAAGDTFSMGDIPIGIMAHRFMLIVPDRPALPGLARWFGEISTRPGFRQFVASVTYTPKD